MTSFALALQIVAITHATVLDLETGSRAQDQTIVIRNRRIAAVGPSASVATPAGARTLNASGKFVIPGLWDMHVHNDVPGGRALLPLYVAYGVTGVRDMNGALGTLRRWQGEIAAGTLVGPRMVVSGPYVVGSAVPLPHLLVRTADEGTAAVDSLARLRVDFIKVHNALRPEAFFAVAREARRRGLVFAGHVYPPVTPLQASDSGQRSQEHLSGFPNECSAADSVAFAPALPLQRFLLGTCTPEPQGPVYSRIARNGTWVNPTLTVQVPVATLQAAAPPGSATAEHYTDSLLAFLRVVMRLPPNPSESAREAGRALFAKRVATVGAMHRAGIAMLTGSDSPGAPSPPGVSLHDELELFVQAGLTPLAALRSATVEPARYFMATDSLGRIAAGHVADMVLLDGDPIADIRNTRRIHAVLADGRVYDASTRAALIANVKRAALQSRRPGSSP
ncbi:MAG TPA: amidohydrolase family protein [Gemmatimonadaceae bacterium]|nr:amidohydrolase family protein [Gemmatimonadaceae bacterium]